MTKAKWQKRLQSFLVAKDIADAIFRGSWEDNSVWDKLDGAIESLQYNLDESYKKNQEIDYFFTLFEQIDYEMLKRMVSELDEINKVLSSVVVDKKVKIVLPPHWKKLLSSLELQVDIINNVWEKVALMEQKDQKKLFENFKYVSLLYGEFSFDFKLILSATLNYVPTKIVIDFADFKKRMNSISVNQNNIDDEDLLVMFRYLGQSFYGFDSEIRGWSTDFIMNFKVDEVVFDSKVDYFLFIIFLQLGFSRFSDSLMELQDMQIRESFWKGFVLGVPIERMIKKTLHSQPMLHFYLERSFSLADSLLKNKEKINLSSSQSVGGFIKRFLALNKGKEFDSYAQINYVEMQIKENKWSEVLKQYLLSLLHLYLHLREADLVDYKGMLSEKDLAESPRWEALLGHDLPKEELYDLEQYLTMQNLPTRFKMEMIVAFQKVDWKNDPFLERVLVLNDLFARVYHPLYSPLVYFDEESGDWKFNKEIPDTWGLRNNEEK